MSMRTPGGKLLVDNWYWFNFKDKPASVRAIEKLPAGTFPDARLAEGFAAYAENRDAPLLRLPRTTLSLTATREGGHGVFTVRNTGAVAAFNVLLEGFPNGWHDFLDDNSFCLGAGESRQIGFEVGDGDG
ncbi:MAG: hypothetical protein M1541_19540, partial [Acidobacteria bacterium]|nr:hypothetical protein [Acidobacteriota bacterium]